MVVVASRSSSRRCGCAASRRTWSRWSRASCCRRSCGTTTRCCCCCRSPGCSTAGRWWAVADPAGDGRAADRDHAARRLPAWRSGSTLVALLAGPDGSAATPGRDRRWLPRRRRGGPDAGAVRRARTFPLAGRLGRLVAPSRSLVYWLSNRAFDAGRGDLFYLADAFLHGRTWIDLASRARSTSSSSTAASTCRSRRSRRSC